jgi:GNAT superfamily N-acetyltransferase
MTTAASIFVRAMDPGDAEAVAALCGTLGYPATTADVLARFTALSSSRDQVFVATDGATVVGWIHAFVSLLIETEPFVEIGGLVVGESVQRRGVGRLLMAQAEAWALARGCRQVRLRSNIVRAGAHRFYESLGYRTLKTQYTFVKELAVR